MMRGLTLVIIALFGFLGALSGQPRTFCAVTISIRNADGLPLRVPVELVNGEGRIVQKTFSTRGEARVCDFGFGLYSIVIARGICGSVTLNGVSVAYGKTHHFDVKLN